jgi:hypothetical protein
MKVHRPHDLTEIAADEEVRQIDDRCAVTSSDDTEDRLIGIRSTCRSGFIDQATASSARTIEDERTDGAVATSSRM